VIRFTTKEWNNTMNKRTFLGKLLFAACAQGVTASAAPSPGRAVTTSPWRHPFDPSFAPDLRERIRRARWSDEVAADWTYGTSQRPLRALVSHWADGYDWNAAAQRLNALPHFRAVIDGFVIHYLHFKGTSPASQPLLLMNGWPSSFVEYGKLAPMLADPAAHGGDAALAFDVVIPALPGFGYSGRPTRPNEVQATTLFHRLMTEGLGYGQYIAAGTDLGAGVATRLALAYPHAVRGIHIAAVVDPPLDEASPALSAEEIDYQRRVKKWTADEGAYLHLQATRPQTAAYALNDSPVGLASWILEKFRYWSDAGPELFDVFPADMLVDNLNVYWSTQTIGSSMRYYYEASHFRAPLKIGDYVSAPTAVCMWPRDLVVAPQAWAERFYNVRQYSVQARGGHFPAWEQPERYAADLRAFAARLGR
jgi:microsomal epoxide hydrolase